MQSDAKTVDDYLEEVPEERKDVLSELRRLCLNIFVDYEETMEYGMPGYKKKGSEIEVAFASQKNYISLYVLKEDVFNEFREDFAGLSLGKGCVRFKRSNQINFEVVARFLAASFKSDSEIC